VAASTQVCPKLIIVGQARITHTHKGQELQEKNRFKQAKTPNTNLLAHARMVPTSWGLRVAMSTAAAFAQPEKAANTLHSLSKKQHWTRRCGIGSLLQSAAAAHTVGAA
jgi:hypothetical protein